MMSQIDLDELHELVVKKFDKLMNWKKEKDVERYQVFKQMERVDVICLNKSLEPLFTVVFWTKNDVIQEAIIPVLYTTVYPDMTGPELIVSYNSQVSGLTLYKNRMEGE